MATSSIKRASPLGKSSESGDDSSYSTRKSAARRHRSLSRYSHRTSDPDSEISKGKFVNTVRGSGFAEISLDDLAVEFFESFSSESGVSSVERGRSGLKSEGVVRRGRSISRGGLGRLDADTESSRRRRSLSVQPQGIEITDKSGGLNIGRNDSNRRRSVSRQPREREITDKSRGLNAGRDNSNRRRSVSRQPREKVNSSESSSGIRGRGIENVNPRRRRSVSVVRCGMENSESDVGRVEYSSNSRELKSSTNGGTHKQGIGRSISRHPIKYHDGYSSHSSAFITDDEGKDSGSSKHGTERIIQTVYAQNKATPKRRESLENSDYATKLRESEERKRDLLAEIMLEEQLGTELSMNLKELQIEPEEKPSRTMPKRSKDRSRRVSLSFTDEAEQYIDEFISNIGDTDFSSFEDERSETSSSFGLIKTKSSQMDGVMLPWLQWEETPDAHECLNKSPHTPKDESIGQGMSIGTKSSRASSSPYDSAIEFVNPITRLKVDVNDYLKRPNSADILNETWKLRHRISSGSLVLCSRSFI